MSNERHEIVTAKLGNEQDDSFSDKCLRELQFGARGLVGGFGEGLKESVHDPWGTGLRLAGSVGIGLTLGVMQREAGLLRMGGQLLGASMGISFMADVATSDRWSKLTRAAGDTWRSPTNFEANVGVAKSALGRFAFDTALMTAAGIGSAKLANRFMVPTNEMKLSDIKVSATEVKRPEIKRPAPVEAVPAPVARVVRPRARAEALVELSPEQLKQRAAEVKEHTQVSLKPEQVGALRDEINLFGKQPDGVLIELMQKNRVLGMGEKHMSPNPHRELATELMPKLREAGATHLALEIDIKQQHILDRFQRTGKFTEADARDIAGLVPNRDFSNMLLAARDAGLKLVAVDNKLVHRDSHMAKTIGKILDADPNSKVIFWVGKHHLSRSYQYDKMAVEYLREKYRVATVTDSAPDRRFRGMPGPAHLVARDLTDPVILDTNWATNLGKMPSNGTIKPHSLWDHVIIYPVRPQIQK